MKIVVTGGAGFIGANLCRTLLRHDIQTTVLDDLSTGNRHNLAGLDVEFVQGSVLNTELCHEVVRGAHSVVHLAAIPSVPRSVADPIPSHLVNTTGTLNILVAASEAGSHVAIASSSSIYGRNPEIPKHEDLVPMPASPYAVSKLAAESYGLAWQATYGLPTINFRFFNVFGPLQAAGHAYAAVVPAFVDAALRGQPLTIHGDGLQTRDFTYIDTVATVLMTAAVRRVNHDRPVNLAFGSRSSLIQVVSILEELLGRPLERRHVDPRVGDVRDSQASSDVLRRLFPEASPFSLRDGMRNTLEWMRAELDAN